MVEVVIVMMIMVTISGIILVSFTGLHEGTAVSRATRELALALRQAQNISLAVTQVDTQSGPKIPSAVGIRLSVGASAYLLFADLTRDNKYDPEVVSAYPDAKIGGERVFEGGARVGSLGYDDELGQSQTVATVYIMFLAPDATILITDQDGSQIGDVLRAELVSVSGGVKKTITVRTSGQISIR